MNGHLRPTFRTIWFVGGGVVSGECLRLGLADEVRYSILPILIGDGIPFFEKLDRDIAQRRSNPTRAAWWSFVTRCEDIVVNHETPPNQVLPTRIEQLCCIFPHARWSFPLLRRRSSFVILVLQVMRLNEGGEEAMAP